MGNHQVSIAYPYNDLYGELNVDETLTGEGHHHQHQHHHNHHHNYQEPNNFNKLRRNSQLFMSNRQQPASVTTSNPMLKFAADATDTDNYEDATEADESHLQLTLMAKLIATKTTTIATTNNITNINEDKIRINNDHKHREKSKSIGIKIKNSNNPSSSSFSSSSMMMINNNKNMNNNNNKKVAFSLNNNIKNNSLYDDSIASSLSSSCSSSCSSSVILNNTTTTTIANFNQGCDCFECKNCNCNTITTTADSYSNNIWYPNSSTQLHQSLQNQPPPPLTSSSASSNYQFITSSMNFVGRLYQGAKNMYNEINPATLTGAIDVVVVQQEDGSFKSSPFHVRFGKLGVLRTREKIVDIEINNEPVEDLHMELGDAGEAYFMEKIEFDDDEQSSSSCESMLGQSENDKDNLNPNLNPNSNEQKKFVDSSLSNIATDVRIVVEDNNNESAAATSAKINYFSDGELTPEPTSPIVSRPTTPKSDTEVEIQKTRRESLKPDMSNQWNWNWGQLPERQQQHQQQQKQLSEAVALIENNNPSSNSNNNNNNSTLKNKFGGIYLDDTDKLDSEVAALYLNQKNTVTATTTTAIDHLSSNPNDNHSIESLLSILGDVQVSIISGSSGFLNSSPMKIATSSTTSSSSLLQSSSVYYSTLKSKSSTDLATSSSSSSTHQDDSLSWLTKSIHEPLPSTSSRSNNHHQQPPSSIINLDELFQKNLVPFERFLEEINTITSNPDLVIKINNRYMDWPAASLIILSAIAYKRPLPNDALNNLISSSGQNSPKIIADNSNKSSNLAQQLPSKNISNSNSNSNSSYWSFWKKNKDVNNNIAAAIAPQKNAVIKNNSAAANLGVGGGDFEERILFEGDLNNNNLSSSSMTIQQQQPTDENESKEYYQRAFSNSSSSSCHNHSPHHHHHHHHHRHHSHHHHHHHSHHNHNHKKETFRKTTRLSSDLIKKLNLKPGANEIKYSITTALQGTTRIYSYIFLWNYDDKIIVSDIDGTITKSDVLGQVLPIFGRDWSQAGIADLYTAIEKNEYKFIYLSARAIGQSQITRDLLRNINQDGFTLPKGPLLVTPSSLFIAFQKEVIEKRPQDFKISCLLDIKSLFPAHRNPYHAGYGNKITDVEAYRTVDIPMPRIFTINPQGEIKHEISQSFQSSYSKLCDFVDLIFPPYKTNSSSQVQHEPIKDDYVTFNYWRSDLNVDSNLLDEIEKASKESSSKLKDNAATSAKQQQQQQQQKSSSVSSVDAATNASDALKKKSSTQNSKQRKVSPLRSSPSVPVPLSSIEKCKTHDENNANNKTNKTAIHFDLVAGYDHQTSSSGLSSSLKN